MTKRTISIFLLLLPMLMGDHLLHAQGLDADESVSKTKRHSLIITEHFIDMPIRDVVDYISEITGKTITLGRNVSGVVSNVKINGLYWTKALRVLARDIDGYFVEHTADWVEITRPPKVTFATDPAGTDIKDILDNIAVSYGFNLAMSSSVSGTVILRLKQVPWREAVEIVAKTAGKYTVVEEDYNILRIVPTEELKEQLETRVFLLKYITGPASVTATRSTSSYATINKPSPDFVLLKALENIVTKDFGFLQFDPDNRAFIIKDTRPVLKQIESLIKQLDRPKPQVSLEVHVVSTTRANFLDLGVDWGTTGPVISMTGGSMLHRLPFQLGDGGFEDQIALGSNPLVNNITSNNIPTSEVNAIPGPDPVIDFTNNGNGTTSAVGTFTAGSLDFSGLKAVLKFVQTDSESKVVQSPNIVAMDNVRATLFSGEEISYAESSQVSAQDGSLNLQFVEAKHSPVNVGFQLFVTPHILLEEGKVILDIVSESSILTGTSSTVVTGFETFGSGVDAIELPRKSSQTVVTQVLLESGRTAMIGGLVSSSDTFTERKVPILGDIPILKFLFNNKSRKKTQTNLTIFIRPTFTLDIKNSRRALLEDLEMRRQRALREFRKNSPENSVKKPK